jgi:hypothetical protein
MSNNLPLVIGLVGSRHYEFDAQNASGSLAVEQAYWNEPAQAEPHLAGAGPLHSLREHLAAFMMHWRQGVSHHA